MLWVEFDSSFDVFRYFSHTYVIQTDTDSFVSLWRISYELNCFFCFSNSYTCHNKQTENSFLLFFCFIIKKEFAFSFYNGRIFLPKIRRFIKSHTSLKKLTTNCIVSASHIVSNSYSLADHHHRQCHR